MKTELESEIIDAFGLAGVALCKIENPDAILQAIKSIYVADDPSAWWTHLKHRKKIFKFENNTGYLHLEEICSPSNGDVWLVIDDQDMLLYCAPLPKVKLIIGECRYFEYYVVANDFSWLISENDHGDLIYCEKGL